MEAQLRIRTDELFERIRQAGVTSRDSIGCSIEHATRSRQLRLEAAHGRTTRLRQRIGWKLRRGALPYDSTPVILGHPGGAGRECAACSKPLLMRHLVMDIPSSDHTVVHLHADCYILWNAVRHKVSASRPPQSLG